MGAIESFIDTYFTQPLAQPATTAPYNPVNTLVFAALALAAAYMIFLGLRKLKIRVDEEFVKSLLPFIFLGAIVRVLVDAAVLPRVVVIAGVTTYPFVTPVIYILTFIAAVVCIAIALYKPFRDFDTTMRLLGTILAVLAVLPLLPLFKHWLLLAQMIAMAAAPVLLFYFAAKRFGGKAALVPMLVVLGQAWDGAATFTGLGAGYFEQHVVGNAIIAYSPFLFYLVKVVFGLVVAWLLSREKESEETTFVALLIIIFGLAPGTRDALRILAGV